MPNKMVWLALVPNTVHYSEDIRYLREGVSERLEQERGLSLVLRQVIEDVLRNESGRVVFDELLSHVVHVMPPDCLTAEPIEVLEQKRLGPIPLH